MSEAVFTSAVFSSLSILCDMSTVIYSYYADKVDVLARPDRIDALVKTTLE